MSKKLTVIVPDETKGGTITILIKNQDGSMSLKTAGIETTDIIYWRKINLEQEVKEWD